ncbi:MAG: formylmethanofuran dehydrogenase subunit C [Caldisericota bacterium]|nr:formylmethanofuran dehydrogenase subunit C [Caldisericota bacterium]
MIRPKTEFEVPVEAEVISPDILARKSPGEIGNLPVYLGNRKMALKDLFEIEGNPSMNLLLEGDFSRVKKIGFGMTQGKIHIKGNVGMHTGATMKGGEILIEGDASDWLGAEMTGGIIRVLGNAGNFAGATYWGGKFGMNRGTILIFGNTGNETGKKMRRGLIAIRGYTGDYLGGGMIGGSIFVFSGIGQRPGAEMKRGSIVLFQENSPNPPELLPTFIYNCTFNPTFLRLYLKALKDYGFPVKEEYIQGNYRRFAGDIVELGKGEILVYEP